MLRGSWARVEMLLRRVVKLPMGIKRKAKGKKRVDALSSDYLLSN